MGLSRFLCLVLVFLAGAVGAQPTPPTDAGTSPVTTYMGLNSNPAAETSYNNIPRAAFQLTETLYQPLSVAPSDIAVASRIGLVRGSEVSDSAWAGLATELPQAALAVGRSEMVLPADSSQDPLKQFEGNTAGLQLILVASENAESAASAVAGLEALGLKAVPLILGASDFTQEQVILLDGARQGAGALQALSVVAPAGGNVQIVSGASAVAQVRRKGLEGAWTGSQLPTAFAVGESETAVALADRLTLANPKPSVLVVLDEAFVGRVAEAASSSGTGCKVIAVGLSVECRSLLDAGKLAAWVRPDLRRLAVHSSLVSRGLAPKGTVVDAEVLLPSQK